MITEEILKLIPKVELHCHLDGSVRVSTIIELARKQNITLPSMDEKTLTDWFIRGARRKSLTLYLEGFSVINTVLQTGDALTRVARELVEDMADENICYAEIRFAPVLHTQKELTAQQAVEAVLQGLAEGERARGVKTRLILCAMRNMSPETSLEIAELAVAFRDRKVVGFDIAGDETGNPPKIHAKAFDYIRGQNFNITIHAGEAFGVESIWQAIQVCGAHRIGHGTHLRDDINHEGLYIENMGSLSHFIQDRRIPIEICLSSNVDTGAVKSYSSHPFPIFFANNFRCFLCTDNRLMSNTTLTKEYELAVKYYGLNYDDLKKLTINAMKSAFIHNEERLSLIYNVIKKRYEEIRQEYGIR